VVEADAVGRFRALVRIPTVSKADPELTDWTAFSRFRDEVAAQYPLVHAHLERELVAEHSLLYRWAGTDPTLPPVVLMAHQDVVDPGEIADWAQGPFDAALDGDVLHGRGTIDDKGSLAGILEAIEQLIASGFTPARDLLLVFGHDEETHGTGARAVAALLADRGIAPAFVLDEGGAIVEDVLPGTTGRLAVIGLAEKGAANIRLRVAEAGGHASTPPSVSAIGRLARAIARIDASPSPARMTEATRKMFAAAGGAARGVFRLLYRNITWTAPLLRRVLARGGPETAAMVRTTRVTTLISGGHAQNAIPERAEATVNARILPGETVETVIARIRDDIADPLVGVEAAGGWDPSPISPTTGPGWELLTAVLRDLEPGTTPIPYTQNGATDSRSFTSLTPAVYRFTPFHLTSGERGGLHAVGERIRVSSWLAGVAFYRELIARL